MQIDSRKIELDLDGQFNPSIHVPTWYQAHDLLPGITDISTRTSPSQSRIKFQGVEINCGYTTWSANTTDLENLPAIINLASNLFFKLLPHTPITSGKISISHRFVEPSGTIASKVQSKISRFGIAPRFLQGAMQWSRNTEDELLGGNSMFWLCGDDSHFHTNHEYTFGIESSFSGSKGLDDVKQLLESTDRILKDSETLSMEIMTALGISDE